MNSCSCLKGTLTFAGDILIRKGGKVHESIVQQNSNPRNIFGSLFSYIEKSEFFLFNFEGALCTDRPPRSSRLPSLFYIRTDPELLPFFQNIHPASICSLANNHIADYGKDAIWETISNFEKAAIRTIGVGYANDLDHPLVIKKAGVSVAFLAFTDLLAPDYFANDTKGVYGLTSENIKRAIAAAKLEADVIVVSLHTSAFVSTKFRDTPDHAQLRWSSIAADCGADLIVGHHPHGIQNVERRGRSTIFHSIGAFIYNPETSKLYPQKHPYHNGTQFHGGSLLKVGFCKHGIDVIDWIATECEFDKDGNFRVIRAGYLQQLKARALLLLK